MKKQMLLNFFIFAIFSTLSLFSAMPNGGVLRVSPELKQCVNAIQELQEGKQLIAQILTEGSLNIQVDNNGVARQFSACWEQDSRTILICLSSHPSKGEVIGSLIFELHNALVSSKMDNLDLMASRGKITKENYVRSFEYLEYLNSINASTLAKKGIDKGIFPQNAQLPTYKNFEEHFYYQKISGHSAVIARNYEIIMQPNFETRFRS